MADPKPDTSVAADPAPAAANGEERSGLPALVLGVIAVALGVVVLVDASRIHAPAGKSVVGPAAFPVGVGILLIVTGGAVAATQAVRALSGRVAWRPLGRVAALLGLLIGYAVLLPRLSYVFSTAALFAGAALLFGSGHRLRTIVIGVALAAAAFVGFAHGIGVSLPAGPWGF